MLPIAQNVRTTPVSSPSAAQAPPCSSPEKNKSPLSQTECQVAYQRSIREDLDRLRKGLKDSLAKIPTELAEANQQRWLGTPQDLLPWLEAQVIFGPDAALWQESTPDLKQRMVSAALALNYGGLPALELLQELWSVPDEATRRLTRLLEQRPFPEAEKSLVLHDSEGRKLNVYENLLGAIALAGTENPAPAALSSIYVAKGLVGFEKLFELRGFGRKPEQAISPKSTLPPSTDTFSVHAGPHTKKTAQTSVPPSAVILAPAPNSQAPTTRPAPKSLSDQLRASDPVFINFDGAASIQVPRAAHDLLLRPRLPVALNGQTIPVKQHNYIALFELKTIHNKIHGV